MNNMKLKEGCNAEVCRSDGGIFQSWFRAWIISCNAHYYQVEYDNLLDDNGERVVEDVRADAVRPEPPQMTKMRKLAPGHIIEVYDNHAWKAGRVVKVLRGRLFVVKLMESLLERKYHLSVIRAQLFWHRERWLHNDEVAQSALPVQENIECSVASSSSSNELHSDKKNSKHELEMSAYRSTMRAFYASTGCLTWERETLLRNLRHELHISDDEHSSELSRLCSRKDM
ncbi:hypothetical protein SUGI_0704140 [Cryptomeria japonica]|uniref:uncharacterized protein LOC131052891 n=1 Tax=Cryptomeria japonica TaxID=3369 RepID=UPI0024147E04|nr:uncharacterized protein LOC131052891 [Cryptomeria japonica]XP_059065363.1 uncharacterized protein LOC131857180 [Cryptomeria japonica]XP_059065365.1 uncharacterized protein LOC131857183 [Cryptomeria japonica]GLJ34980.1 hypothetical protein SUGI_0704040 [Cryptomeria japonica]GLJ34983.1 hypothetical protein SUGI_0704070 [Cryptomeria japonica]GLJ34989.1 hypothetical protein SUGI_0704140 [Cryptomeria japonica]